MKYKLVALDVDGTLLTDEYRMTELTKQSLQHIHQMGVRIVLCTGRNPISTYPLMRELQMEGLMITHNGAATVEYKERRVEGVFSFPLEKVFPFIEFCRKERIQFDVNVTFEMYAEQLHDGMAELYSKYMITPKIMPDITRLTEEPVKFTVTAEHSVMDELEREWSLPDDNLQIIRSGSEFIDVMNAQANKGSALQKLAEAWDIYPDQIMAIGNYNNDIEMIQFAGLGIAMDNSPDEVKQAADAVTESNNDEGVHKAIMKYMLEI